MEKKQNFFQVIIGVILLIAVASSIFYLLRLLWITLTSINTSLAVGLVTASATIIVSVISIIFSKYFERKAVIEDEHRQRKIPIYNKLIEFTFEILISAKNGKALESSEAERFMKDFTQEVLVWGSDEVINSFYKLRQASFNPVGEKEQVLFYFEDVLLKIRKDLGHKNKDIGKGKLLGLFINDIERYIN